MEIIGIRIVMAICMLPVLPILLGALWFLAEEKNGTQFGVTLWQGAREQPEVQEIKKSYQKELKIKTLISLLLFVLALLPKYESLLITGTTVWMFFSIVYLFFPLGRANRRMQEQKREFLASRPKEADCEQREEILVDVTAAQAEKTKYPRKALYAGCVFTFLAPAAEIFLYRVWYRPWLPELWVNECILLSIAAAGSLFPVSLWILEKQRTRVLTYNSQVNLQVDKIRKYHLSRFFTAAVWLTGLLNWGLLCILHGPVQWFPWLIGLASLLFGIAVTVLVVVCWKRIEKNSRRYLAQELPAEENDDKYWIWGMIYCNKNDSRSFVEARIGLGITANMGKPVIKYATILILAVVGVFTLGVCGWCVLEEFVPVSLSYEDGTLTANHWKKVYQIERSEIKEAELLEEEPKISRKNGTGMASVKKGNFYSDTYRRDFKVCINPKEPPFLMIETSDGRWYLLGGSCGEETRKLYQSGIFE